MRAALIGYTGFVGGNLAQQASFDALFNSQNIEEIAGQNFDLVVVSGMPAAKWIANANPAGDRQVLDRLSGCVLRATARQMVVISTVDVYPRPTGVDEDTPIDPAEQHPYGRHRLQLENELAAHFPSVLTVRLPALFGPGLKKNAVYDLLHNNELHKVHSENVFQFYNVARLWSDLQTALAAELRLVNFATEPMSISQIAQEAFGVAFHNDPGSPAVRYDFRSKHAHLYGGRQDYLFDQAHVLTELRAFVASEQARLP